MNDYNKLVSRLKKQGAEDPNALASEVGRKKLNKVEFQRNAVEGRKKSLMKRRP
tara:strand:- start:104 stop:265 length:162 start_codon:yes stop_codon:yes gene_type:complete